MYDDSMASGCGGNSDCCGSPGCGGTINCGSNQNCTNNQNCGNRGYCRPNSCCCRGPQDPTGPMGATGPVGPAGLSAVAPVMHALMSVSDAPQAPGRNGLIYFTDSLLIKGTDIVHPMNIGKFSLVENGTYEISYHTIGTNSATANPPVLVGVHLTANFAVIPGTTITIRKLD